MNCEECRDYLDAYLDDELDATATVAVRRHLQDCPECRQLLEARQSLHALLADPQLPFELPGDLRAKVVAALPAAPWVRTPPSPSRVVIPWSFVPWALAAALALMLGLAVLYQGTGPGGPGDRALAAQVVSGHVRSLLAAHLFDVPSSDQHTVKPWFAGKLEFSPPVRDFADRGFPLAGGRLDYVDGRAVAALVYRHGAHVINLFVWPSAPGAATPAQNLAEKGYNVAHWEQGGFTFWAVTDARAEELKAFTDLQITPS